MITNTWKEGELSIERIPVALIISKREKNKENMLEKKIIAQRRGVWVEEEQDQESNQKV